MLENKQSAVWLYAANGRKGHRPQARRRRPPQSGFRQPAYEHPCLTVSTWQRTPHCTTRGQSISFTVTLHPSRIASTLSVILFFWPFPDDPSEFSSEFLSSPKSSSHGMAPCGSTPHRQCCEVSRTQHALELTTLCGAQFVGE